MTSLLNIFWLGLKEIRSLVSDAVMVLFVVYAFTLAIYIQATGTSSEVNNASIAFVDEDGSALSKELLNAFYPPRFKFPQLIGAADSQAEMDRGNLMFVVVIPPMFEHDLVAGRNPAIQANIDATAMQQAGIGAGYIRSIITDRVSSFLKRREVTPEPPVKLVIRKLFNPNSTSSWFKSVVAIINQISLLTIVLTGAAVIREREHGTMDHLLTMPLSPVEIASAKVLANGFVISVATTLSLYLVVRGLLAIPIAGSIPLFLCGVMLYLFFASAVGLFLATVARSMPQLGLLFMLVFLPMQMLSGGNTPIDSEPPWLQAIMQCVASTHFVSFAQAILYRGAGFSLVWPDFLAVAGFGALFFTLAVLRFRKVSAVAVG